MTLAIGAVASGCAGMPSAAEIPLVVVTVAPPGASLVARAEGPLSPEVQAPQKVPHTTRQKRILERPATLAPKPVANKPAVRAVVPPKPRVAKARKPGTCHPQDPLCSDLP